MKMRFPACLAAGLCGLLLAACGPLPPPRTTPPRPPRPAGAATVAPGALPNLTIELCWNNARVTLPPPIDVQQKVYNTPEYRRWQYYGTTSQTTCLDAGGYKYAVRTVGKSHAEAKTAKSSQSAGLLGAKKKKKSKNAKEKLKENLAEPGVYTDNTKVVISCYRPDGTLDNVTTLRADSSLDSWITYGPDGIARLVRVQMRSAAESPTGAPLIQWVDFFEPDRIRRLQVNAQNVAWQELAIGETGVIRSRLHEDPSKADRLTQLNTGVK